MAIQKLPGFLSDCMDVLRRRKKAKSKDLKKSLDWKDRYEYYSRCRFRDHAWTTDDNLSITFQGVKCTGYVPKAQRVLLKTISKLITISNDGTIGFFPAHMVHLTIQGYFKQPSFRKKFKRLSKAQRRLIMLQIKDPETRDIIKEAL